MSKYLLYGNEIIENDNTLKDFAQSLCNGVPTESFKKEFFKKEFMETVYIIIDEDISRTDLSYEELMHKYRLELGNLLYEMDNNGYDIPVIKFFGDDAKTCFNNLVYAYIDIYFNELVQIG